MSQLKDCLDYYKSISAPGYAVLVSGAWGVGKTYQVKKALKSDERYYVSLFGLESREAIEAVVLTEANPSLKKAKGFANWGTQKAKEVGGLWSLVGIVPSAINSLLKIELDRKKVIVFDDLERCQLDLTTLLGIINWFVEHQDSKVVVIAHDEKLGENLQGQKEKVFGQTIYVRPEPNEAFSSFLKEIEKSEFMSAERTKAACEFLRKNRELIFSIFKPQEMTDDQDNVHTYEGNSLRVLRRSLFDLARLYSIIKPKFLENDNAISQLITEFFILNLEFKMGSLPAKSLGVEWNDKNHLRWVRNRRREQEDNIQLSPLEKLENKYTQIKLDGLLLDPRFLYEAIVEGNYDATLLNNRLSDSTYYASPEDLPAWRRFMSFDDLDDEVVEQAKNELLDQFENRELHEVGAILHMFALRFMMSENSIIAENIETVEQSCRTYIDDLLSSGDLPPRRPNSSLLESFRFESSHGHGYWVTDAYRDNFNNVYKYLNEACTRAFENQGTEVAQEILTALQTDPEEFTKLISYRLGEGKYASIPVMHSIDIEELVEAWLSIPKTNWRTIQYAFNSRYETGGLQNDEHKVGDLVVEREWAFQLRQCLEARAEALGGYKGLRITRIIPRLPQAG